MPRPRVQMPPPTQAEHVLAHRLAAEYQRGVSLFFLGRRTYWKSGVSLERQRGYSVLIRAARLCREYHADPVDWMRAQFYCWDGPRDKYPFITQIGTAGALRRYERWTRMLQTWTESERQSARNVEFQEYEQKKLDRMVAARKDGATARQVLGEWCREFSRPFLEYHGVWQFVQDRWGR